MTFNGVTSLCFACNVISIRHLWHDWPSQNQELFAWINKMVAASEWLTIQYGVQVHGTCLGMEVLSVIAAQNSTLLSK